MSIKRVLFCFVFCLPFLHSHAGSGYVRLADTTKIFYVKGNEIYSPDDMQLMFFQKGNIFFTGNSDDKQNIYLMATAMDIGSRKLQSVYERDDRTPLYSFAENKFYLGKPDGDQLDQNELMHIERSGKWLAFYSSVNDSLLGFYNADSLPAPTAVITAYTLINRFDLSKKLKEKIKQATVQPVTAGFSSIKPAWGNPTDNEWIWDGKLFRPRWNPDVNLVWTFDGATVKPAYGNNINLQYEWDGENFKPLWRTNRAEEWLWDGRVLKPTWNSDWDNQYTIEDGVLKPWSNVHPEREWRITGDIPIPLIILIVTGIARAN